MQGVALMRMPPRNTRPEEQQLAAVGHEVGDAFGGPLLAVLEVDRPFPGVLLAACRHRDPHGMLSRGRGAQAGNHEGEAAGPAVGAQPDRLLEQGAGVRARGDDDGRQRRRITTHVGGQGQLEHEVLADEAGLVVHGHGQVGQGGAGQQDGGQDEQSGEDEAVVASELHEHSPSWLGCLVAGWVGWPTVSVRTPGRRGGSHGRGVSDRP